MQTLMAILGFLILAGASPRQDEAVAKTFEQYEAIRVALAADHIKGLTTHAASLAPLAEAVAGVDARRAVEALGAATTLATAREHFGKVSAALVPAFEKAKLKDVHVFTCSMVGQSWAQKGKDIQNPYYGKSMLACGVPKK